MHAPKPRCQSALALFADKAFEQWNGLPAECRASDVFATFAVLSEESAVAKLGSEFRPTLYKVCTVPNYDEPVHVWFEDNRIVKIEVQYPKLSQEQCAAIVAALGEPTGKLAYYFYTFEIPAGEWAYAERGLALFFNEDRTGLVKLTVYHPTSLEDYEARIRPSVSPAREFPLPED